MAGIGRNLVFAFFLSALLVCANEPPAEMRAFLGKNCVACHGPEKPPAGLNLAALPFRLDDPHARTQWVRVHDAVRDGAMPPGGGKTPERQRFLASLADPIASYERREAQESGRSVLRRLNRYEYENTVRDLLHAPWLQLRDSLPEDGIVQRFNKSGQALDVSHVQMARYMETADHALRLVLRASQEPETTKRYYAREQQRFLNRMRYSPFNRSPERATIPILGFDAQPDVLAEKVPITVGEKDPETRELEGFATPASTYIGNEYHFDQFAAPVGGRYRLRFHAYSIWIHTLFQRIGTSKRAPWWRPDRERTSQGRTTEPLTIYALSRGGEKRLLGTFDVGPEPAVHELDVFLLPDEKILPDASRLFRSRPGFLGSPDASAEGMPGIAYRWMEVTGPAQSAESRAIQRELLEPQDPDALLRRFMAKAYRRPPREEEIARYRAIVAGGPADFTEAMIAAYIAVLCSPGFLYLEEQPGRLDPYALASRLSYFLWNTAPDAELRRLAADGTLARPEVLRAQTARLLDSPRMRDFTDAFLDYWLDLRKAGETTPDVILYPEYYLDDLLVESALAETRGFFHSLIRENLSARNVVHSDFTLLNAHLARHYGLPAVDGSALRKVALPADSVRGGLLTQASVLKITANGTTTSPVLRGAWIMERILGEPPPPPPPDVPAVEPDTRGATTIREQLDKHRSIQSCAACHRKIDPPGFALENFDVLGGWRDRHRSTEEGESVPGIGKNGHPFSFRLSQPVDASGELATGESFRDIREFKRLLLKDERRIAGNLVRQWIVYGTGAPVRFADRGEVERILDAAAGDGFRMRALLHEIVGSGLFLNK
ncbi:MAG: DUF1592 domain-containing protein [Bryobacterales bacterium]|nr:DUF1592 domain-containing protein [Bryobacterales bacterium]